MQCSLIKCANNSEDSEWCQTSTLLMAAPSSIETSVNFYHTTHHHILQYGNLHSPTTEPNTIPYTHNYSLLSNKHNFAMSVRKTLCELVVASGDANMYRTLPVCLFIYSLFNEAVTTSEYTLTRCEAATHLYVVMILTWNWAERHTSSAQSYTWQAHQIRNFTLCFILPKGYTNYLWLLCYNTFTVH